MAAGRPRLGFVGLGWIGRARLEAVAHAHAGTVAALCDADAERLSAAARDHSGAATFTSDADLFDAAGSLDLDGVVLATPNGLHCAQALAALARGLAVFVQKPMATSASDVERMLTAARSADRSLEVDYSYRGLVSARELRRRIAGGALGEVFFIDAAFHNAWGPDKAWCYDPAVSGGGCMLDLGVHLADLALFVTGRTAIGAASGWTRGLADHPDVDGFACADFRLDDGPRVHLATSWHAHTGRDCEFRLNVLGTAGAAEIRNAGGSFYDFELCVRESRSEQVVSREGRAWMDRGVVEWAERMAHDRGYDDAAATNLHVARLVDAVYGREPLPSPGSGEGSSLRLDVAARSSSALPHGSGRGLQR